jgi:hypothetical protein
METTETRGRLPYIKPFFRDPDVLNTSGKYPEDYEGTFPESGGVFLGVLSGPGRQVPRATVATRVVRFGHPQGGGGFR